MDTTNQPPTISCIELEPFGFTAQFMCEEESDVDILVDLGTSQHEDIFNMWIAATR